MAMKIRRSQVFLLMMQRNLSRQLLLEGFARQDMLNMGKPDVPKYGYTADGRTYARTCLEDRARIVFVCGAYPHTRSPAKFL